MVVAIPTKAADVARPTMVRANAEDCGDHSDAAERKGELTLGCVLAFS